MPTLQRTDMSCGTQIMYGLHFIDRYVLNRILQPQYKNWGARNDQATSDGHIYKGETIVFSDAIAHGNGVKLEKLIKQYDLGRVVKLSTKNPNTGNQITTYLWCYNGNKIDFNKVFNGNRKPQLQKRTARPTARRRPAGG